jgi:hypothetical protein
MKTRTLDYYINIQKQEKNESCAKQHVMIYLPSSTFSILSTLDDTREIQQLQIIREEALRANIYLEKKKGASTSKAILNYHFMHKLGQ